MLVAIVDSVVKKHCDKGSQSINANKNLNYTKNKNALDLILSTDSAGMRCCTFSALSNVI